MFKYFCANSTRKYIDVLDELLDQYNNTVHSSIKMTPVEASKKANELKVWRNLYGYDTEFGTKPKFSVGDRVRITKKTIFDNDYTPRWTEVFTVSAIQYTNPPTYKIRDLNGEEIQGTFYEPELQLTKQEIYRIEKVIRRKGSKSLVKWLGYPKEFNSWVNNDELISLKN